MANQGECGEPHPVQLFVGAKPDPARLDPIENGDGRRAILVKPCGGLWTATWNAPARTSAWIEWCREEGQTPWVARRGRWLLTPHSAARILTIDRYADLVRALRRYPSPRLDAFWSSRYLDYERLAVDYDAIYLTDRGQHATRLTDPNLYGWDCECTLWLRWSFTAVQKLVGGGGR